MGIIFQAVLALTVFALTYEQLCATTLHNSITDYTIKPETLSHCLTSEIERRARLMDELFDNLSKHMKEVEATIAKENLDEIKCDQRDVPINTGKYKRKLVSHLLERKNITVKLNDALNHLDSPCNDKRMKRSTQEELICTSQIEDLQAKIRDLIHEKDTMLGEMKQRISNCSTNLTELRNSINNRTNES